MHGYGDSMLSQSTGQDTFIPTDGEIIHGPALAQRVFIFARLGRAARYVVERALRNE